MWQEDRQNSAHTVLVLTVCLSVSVSFPLVHSLSLVSVFSTSCVYARVYGGVRVCVVPDYAGTEDDIRCLPQSLLHLVFKDRVSQ